MITISVEDTPSIIFEVRTLNEGRDRAIRNSDFPIGFSINIFDLSKNFAGLELALALGFDKRILT